MGSLSLLVPLILLLLEIIFDVQIFVFSSDIGRKNPISDEESTLNIPTLEVPRCKHTHIRHNNDNDIVCLYKNHGHFLV